VAKVTSKRQITIPKAVADRYGIAAGDDLDFVAAGEWIRLEPRQPGRTALDRTARLALFDRATQRQQEREVLSEDHRPADRGWHREDLYARSR
jgi:AbrB family looped-hinge helix DNA binding protein